MKSKPVCAAMSILGKSPTIVEAPPKLEAMTGTPISPDALYNLVEWSERWSNQNHSIASGVISGRSDYVSEQCRETTSGC